MKIIINKIIISLATVSLLSINIYASCKSDKDIGNHNIKGLRTLPNLTTDTYNSYAVNYQTLKNYISTKAKRNYFDPFTYADNWTDNDGNIYKTIKVANGKRWITTNLHSKSYEDGTQIEKYSKNIQNSDIYSVPGFDKDEIIGKDLFKTIDSQGFYYNSSVALNSKNICGHNFHVSTADDWDRLEKQLGLLNQEQIATINRGIDSTKKLIFSKFNAKFTGWRNSDNGTYYNRGTEAYFWITNDNDYSSQILHSSNFMSDNKTISTNNKLYSIRCVED
jgi:uncharacterized protein (TIGR02145 family)